MKITTTNEQVFMKGYLNMINMLEGYYTIDEIQSIASKWYEGYREYALRLPPKIEKDLDDQDKKQKYEEYYDKIKLINRKKLDNVLALGRGAILVGLHEGLFLLYGDILSRYFYKATYVIMGKEIHDASLAEKISSQVAKEKAPYPKVDYLEARSLNIGIKLMWRLRKNEVVIILLDSPYGVGQTPKKGIEIEFLNQRMWVRKGFAELAYRSRAGIIPIFSYDDENNTPVIELDNPIFPDYEVEMDEGIRSLIGNLYGIMEKFVVRSPQVCWRLFEHDYLIDESDKVYAKNLKLGDELYIQTSPNKIHILEINDKKLLIDVKRKRMYKPTKTTPILLSLLYKGDTVVNLLNHFNGKEQAEQIREELQYLNQLGVLAYGAKSESNNGNTASSVSLFDD